MCLSFMSKGFDVADNVILERMRAGDLVVTQDVPLAAEVVEKGGLQSIHGVPGTTRSR